MQSHQKQKRKAEKGDEANKPPAKKMKQELLALQSSNVTYKSQVRAVCEIFMVHAVTSQLLKSEYEGNCDTLLCALAMWR